MAIINKCDTGVDTQLVALLSHNVDVTLMLQDLLDMAENPEISTANGFATLELRDDQVVARARLASNTCLVDARIPVGWHFTRMTNGFVFTMVVTHYNRSQSSSTLIRLRSSEALQELQDLVSRLQAETLDVLYMGN